MSLKLKFIISAALITTIIVAVSSYICLREYIKTNATLAHTAQEIVKDTELHLDKTIFRIKGILDVQTAKMAHLLENHPEDIGNLSIYSNDLNSLIGGSNEITGTYIFNKQGDMLKTSDKNSKVANVSDRKWFKELKENPDLDIVFSEPLIAKTNGRKSIVISKAFKDSKDQFAGVATVLLDVELEEHELQKLMAFEPNGVVALRYIDSTILAIRYPHKPELWGKPFEQDFSIINKPEFGNTEIIATDLKTADGKPRLNIFKKINNWPFYVKAGVSTDIPMKNLTIFFVKMILGTLAIIILINILIYRLYKNTIQKEYFQALNGATLNSLEAQICVINKEGYIIATNDKWDQFYSNSTHKNVKNCWLNANYIMYCKTETHQCNQDHNDGESVIQGISDVFNKKTNCWTYEYRCDSPTEHRWFLITITPVNGNDNYAVISHTNITTIKQSEVQLKNAKEMAEHTTQLKSNFLANMSHEIRTPMNGVLGLTKLARQKNKDPELNEYLDNILASGEGLLVILNDILDLSKIEAGKLNVSKKPFKLATLIQEIQQLLTPKAIEKKLTFSIVNNVINDNFIGDDNRIKQVILNIIGNAIKFTHIGTVNLTINQTITSNNIILHFVVEDTGIGISEETKEKLFKPFSQADNSIARTYGGTGLGLIISKQLISLMGGDITFTSTEGAGTIFTINIPVEQAAQETTTINKQLEIKKLPKNLNILVVEDNLINQKITSEFLKQQHATVEIATNGIDCLNIIKSKQQPYDIILMDIQMPIMGGVEATYQIKQNDIHKKTPIIALTAAVTKEEQSEYISSGMVDVISKPINPEQLINAILVQLDKQYSDNKPPIY